MVGYLEGFSLVVTKEACIVDRRVNTLFFSQSSPITRKFLKHDMNCSSAKIINQHLHYISPAVDTASLNVRRINQLSCCKDFGIVLHDVHMVWTGTVGGTDIICFVSTYFQVTQSINGIVHGRQMLCN
jgi:hypothetical protein